MRVAKVILCDTYKMALLSHVFGVADLMAETLGLLPISR